MRLPLRTAAATSLAAILLVGLTACGDADTAAVSAPTTENVAAAPAGSGEHATGDHTQGAATTAALKARGTGNPFADARTAAAHMPMSAQVTAAGIVKAAKIKGNSDSKAADLRSGLTYLLTEHVYLAGVAVATAYHAGPDSPEFKLAAATLDENSKAVAAAVGSVAPDEEKGFLAAWRAHVGDFVTYAVGAKTGGKDGAAMKKEAVANLTAYAKSQGVFFQKISGGALKASVIEKDLNGHIASLAAAVDSFAAGKTDGYAKLSEAAHHMSGSAAVLAAGIDKAANVKGDPNDPASALRAELTRMFVDHVYRAGIAVFTAYTAGLDSAAFKAAAADLDANSVEISKAVGSVAGAKNQKVFLAQWRSHIGDFVNYAKGRATGDQKLIDTSLANLDAYRATAGAFFDKITAGALPAKTVSADLKGHIETLAGAIDSLKAALVK
ncbi:MAG: hypothetical protein ACT4QG_06390 [Sporichthyaceae bacterium]